MFSGDIKKTSGLNRVNELETPFKNQQLYSGDTLLLVKLQPEFLEPW